MKWSVNLGEERAEPRNVYPLLGEGERSPGTKAQHPLAYDAGQGSSNKREFWALRFFTGNLYVSTQPNY